MCSNVIKCVQMCERPRRDLRNQRGEGFLCGAMSLMLRATRWTLRAIVRMLRATRWTLRATVRMLRATGSHLE
eukprot:6128967-Pyramimonas_sp.AAC.1